MDRQTYFGAQAVSPNSVPVFTNENKLRGPRKPAQT